MYIWYVSSRSFAHKSTLHTYIVYSILYSFWEKLPYKKFFDVGIFIFSSDVQSECQNMYVLTSTTYETQIFCMKIYKTRYIKCSTWYHTVSTFIYRMWSIVLLRGPLLCAFRANEPHNLTHLFPLSPLMICPHPNAIDNDLEMHTILSTTTTTLKPFHPQHIRVHQGSVFLIASISHGYK